MDPTKPRKLLEQVSDLMRVKHYSYRTEQTYIQWIRRYILFHHKRHPLEMGEAEVEAFLTHLAVHKNVAASTQNQALCALIFYIVTFSNNLSRNPSKQFEPTPQLTSPLSSLLQKFNTFFNIFTVKINASPNYSTAQERLTEGIPLRVKDIDFAQSQIIVRNPKGNYDRTLIHQ